MDESRRRRAPETGGCRALRAHIWPMLLLAVPPVIVKVFAVSVGAAPVQMA